MRTHPHGAAGGRPSMDEEIGPAVRAMDELPGRGQFATVAAAISTGSPIGMATGAASTGTAAAGSARGSVSASSPATSGDLGDHRDPGTPRFGRHSSASSAA